MELKQRIKKLQSLLNARKRILDHHRNELAKIKRRKIELNNKIEETKNQYIESVEKLNAIRGHNDRLLLPTEQGTDYLRDCLYDYLGKLKTIQKMESEQRSMTIKSQKQVKTVENLIDRSLENLRKSTLDQEQKIQDDLSIYRQSNTKNRNGWF